jgi:penicillin-binding protein 2
MKNMVARDSRFQVVRAAGMTMSGKTGTAQQSKTHANHVLFVGFAPSDSPEIAFSIRIANGYSSGYPAEIGRDMVRKYFNLADDSQLIYGRAGVLSTETHTD